MKDVLLTSPSFVKSITPVGDNVNEKTMQFAIRETQEYKLAQVIGGTMLEKLKQLIADNLINEDENVNYKKLLDAAQYFIAYNVIVELAIPLSYKFDNAGVTTTSDDKIENVNLKDIFSIKDYYTKKVDFYRQQLQYYILNNLGKLPEITTQQCNSIHSELNSSASTSIFLGGARSKYNKGGKLRDRYRNYSTKEEGGGDVEKKIESVVWYNAEVNNYVVAPAETKELIGPIIVYYTDKSFEIIKFTDENIEWENTQGLNIQDGYIYTDYTGTFYLRAKYKEHDIYSDKGNKVDITIKSEEVYATNYESFGFEANQKPMLIGESTLIEGCLLKMLSNGSVEYVPLAEAEWFSSNENQVEFRKVIEPDRKQVWIDTKSYGDDDAVDVEVWCEYAGYTSEKFHIYLLKEKIKDIQIANNQVEVVHNQTHSIPLDIRGYYYEDYTYVDGSWKNDRLSSIHSFIEDVTLESFTAQDENNANDTYLAKNLSITQNNNTYMLNGEIGLIKVVNTMEKITCSLKIKIKNDDSDHYTQFILWVKDHIYNNKLDNFNAAFPSSYPSENGYIRKAFTPKDTYIYGSSLGAFTIYNLKSLNTYVWTTIYDFNGYYFGSTNNYFSDNGNYRSSAKLINNRCDYSFGGDTINDTLLVKENSSSSTAAVLFIRFWKSEWQNVKLLYQERETYVKIQHEFYDLKPVFVGNHASDYTKTVLCGMTLNEYYDYYYYEPSTLTASINDPDNVVEQFNGLDRSLAFLLKEDCPNNSEFYVTFWLNDDISQREIATIKIIAIEG